MVPTVGVGRESGNGVGSGLSDEQNVVWGAVGGAERGGAQSDEMKGGRDEELEER